MTCFFFFPKSRSVFTTTRWQNMFCVSTVHYYKLASFPHRTKLRGCGREFGLPSKPLPPLPLTPPTQRPTSGRGPPAGRGPTPTALSARSATSPRTRSTVVRSAITWCAAGACPGCRSARPAGRTSARTLRGGTGLPRGSLTPDWWILLGLREDSTGK